MSDQAAGQGQNSSTSSESAFTWHPTYGGKSFDHVRAELAEEIGRDQRSYKIALEGAEGAEHDSLSTIVALERRWSSYDFEWSETDPGELANRILRFEQERERQRELIPFADYRASGALLDTTATHAPTTSRSLPIVPIGIAVLVVLLVVFLIVALGN